eukprot:scaffold7021_cov45-Cyclotella_meneghiniana.AAC.2
MGQRFSKEAATLLAPSMEGNLDEVKRLVGKQIATTASKNGHDTDALLLKAFVNRTDDAGNCAMHGAVSKNSSNDDDDSYLLRDANNTGDSPLLASASRGNVEICQFLLNSVEDDTKCKLLRCDNKAGDTPLKVAVAGGHESTVKLLLEAEEASVTSNHSDDKDNYCVNRKNNLGLSPLIVACERNLPNIVDLLIHFKATNVTIRDNKGRHALS